MLVRLYDLPSFEDDRARLLADGVNCRRVETYERRVVLQFVRERWPEWVDEAEAAFGYVPPSMYVAIDDNEVVGFACYNVVRPDMFGPTGVAVERRLAGIGSVLLWQCLSALAAQGYAYAIIAGVGPADFYARTVGATLIEGSNPGIYRNFLRPEPS